MREKDTMVIHDAVIIIPYGIKKGADYIAHLIMIVDQEVQKIHP